MVKPELGAAPNTGQVVHTTWLDADSLGVVKRGIAFCTFCVVA